MTLVVLIGASGSGKTSIARAIADSHAEQASVQHFGSICVPEPEEMPPDWQRENTIEWMIRLAPLVGHGMPILFEGQTRLSFLAESAARAGVIAYLPILVDCDDTTRTRRLVFERRQSELANPMMMNWARFLREDAAKQGCEILDTSALPLVRCVELVRRRLGLSRARDDGGQ
ncbi:MAG TPA: hypothetical protein VL418_09330 [Devosiaceae bacterium]|nr:hypothetical protein [Devosiaceae bacterium]